MRVLIDNCLPVGLRHAIEGHEVETAAFRGWGQLTNGELIQAAVGAGFDAIITIDQGGEFEAALRGQSIIGVLLPGRAGNRLPSILPLVPEIHEALATGRQGQIHRIGDAGHQPVIGT